MFANKQHVEPDNVVTYKEESMNGTFRFLNRDGWDRTSLLRFKLGTNYLDAGSLPSEAYERRSFRKKPSPLPEIKNGQKVEKEEDPKPVSLNNLFKYAKPSEKFLIYFGCICGAIAGLGIPASIVLFGRVTNTFVYGSNNTGSNNSSAQINNRTAVNFDAELTEFGVAMVILGVLHLIFSYLMVICLNIAAEKQIFRIRTVFLKSVLRQNIGWYDTNQSGDFATTSVENLSKLRDGIGEKFGMCAFFISNFISSITVALIYGWKLTLVILSVTPILIAATAIFSKMQNSLTDLEMKAYSKAGSVCEEALSAIRTVVAFGGEEKAVEKYESKLINAKETGKKRGLISAIGNGIGWFINYSSYSIAFWYGIKLIIENQQDNSFEYDPSVLIIVFFCAIFGALNVGQLGPYLESIGMARASAAMVYQIIEREPPIDSSSSEGKKLPTFQGAVEFKEIHFSYPSRRAVQILKGVSLAIKPGETVALVGSSGCGKSTLLQLVQRFYDPQRGEVCVDGYDVKQLNLKWLRDKIGVVGQEPVLFGMSIRENIRLGRDNVSEEEMITAAKAAMAHDFIMKLPLKYDTLVGERGAQLSGGQKQRIAIARALVKDPRILLLDEATSALDTHSEAKVQAALDAAGSGRTTIIVAHRLSTVKNANRIIALQKGKVVEVGTHNELMIKKGFYFQLVQSQIKPEKEDKDHSESDDEVISDRRSVRLVRTVSSAGGQNVNTTTGNAEVESEDEVEKLKPSLFRIMKMNAKEWPQILVGCIGSLGFGCTTPCYALLFGEIMRVLSITDHQQKSEESIFYSCLFLAIGAWAGICTFLQIYMFASAGEQLTMRLRKLTFEAILRQDISWFDSSKNSTGALCARLATDASNVQGATGSRIGTLLQVFGSLGLAITLALVLVWKQALASMTLIPLVFIGTYFEGKLVTGQSVADMKAIEEAGKIATEAISNIRTIASLCREDTFLQMYTEAILKTQQKLNRRMQIHGLLFGFAQAVPTFSYALSLTYGGYLIKNEGVKYEDVFKVGELLIFGTMMLGQSIAFAPNYNKGLVSASRIFSLLDRVPSIDSSGKTGIVPDKKVAGIEYRHVKFTYPTRPGDRILSEFNCKIDHGKTIALVGSSGCGKSTCVQLLERFYNPIDGSVLFGDTDIRDINVKWFRGQLGLVSQEPILFDCSISQNIAYGDNSREVGMNEIIDAAKKANIHNFVTSLPLGYDTNVGSKGTQLSGGQKQRIAIARALVRNPKILLLDEATSALDTESEKIVQDALDQAMVGRTCIMIAHRLTTVQKADCILVVHNGKVVEQGSHNQLIARRGLYYNLHSTSNNRQG